MRLVGIAVGVGVALVLSGCGQSVDGQPEVSGAPLTKEQLFDPCGVPESALVAAGADPASKDDNPFSVPRAEWKGCGWNAGDHFISLFTTANTMQEVRANDYLHDFKDVTVGDRKATQYLLGTRTPPNQCGLAFESSQGTVLLQASKFIDDKSPTDPCTLANDAAPHFVSVLPR
ncbi:DUF3558 domain-containing protein [Nocardia sp. GTS18]|uniref:DUF3558 domain-containing protein n=1 Tax=Nocardia sp. GTS18 TaxID=1778064 RepID=UPI0015EE9DCA|nr:DUF3558 domain-containing protein [Nocardia sp. GTS18]